MLKIVLFFICTNLAQRKGEEELKNFHCSRKWGNFFEFLGGGGEWGERVKRGSGFFSGGAEDFLKVIFNF